MALRMEDMFVTDRNAYIGVCELCGITRPEEPIGGGKFFGETDDVTQLLMRHCLDCSSVLSTISDELDAAGQEQATTLTTRSGRRKAYREFLKRNKKKRSGETS